MRKGNPHTLRGKGFDAHPEHIFRKKKEEPVAYSTPNYSKKEIKPYLSLDADQLPCVPFGEDNLFPQALALFSRLSPSHRGVLTSKEKYYHGGGIIASDTYSEGVLLEANAEGENYNQVQKKLWIDDHRFGNVWVEFITDRKGSFLFVNHIDATKCRLARDLKTVLIYPDWSAFTSLTDPKLKKIGVYPNWTEDEENKGILRTVYHKYSYEPEFYYYGIPAHISGKDAIQIDFKTNKWNLARLVNSFSTSGLLVIPVKDKAESKAVLDIIEKHVGEGNQGKVLPLTKSRAAEGQKAEEPTFTPFTSTESGSWMDLHRQSLSDIVMAHGWYRSLCSIPDNTGFDTQRIINEWNIALPQIVEAQGEYVSLFKKMHSEVVGKDLNIEFKNSTPLHSDKYHYIWEMREKNGLPFDPKDPAQNVIILT